MLLLPAAGLERDGRLAVVLNSARHGRHVDQHIKLVERIAHAIDELGIEARPVKLEPLTDGRHRVLRLPTDHRTRCQQRLRQRHRFLDLDVAAGLQCQVQRRASAIGFGLHIGSGGDQLAHIRGVVRLRGGMQGGSTRSAVLVHVRPQLQQHVDAASAAARPHMQGRTAALVRRMQISALFPHQPAHQFVGAQIERNRGLLGISPTCIDLAGIEDGFQRVQIAFFKQFIKVLGKQLFLGHDGKMKGKMRKPSATLPRRRHHRQQPIFSRKRFLPVTSISSSRP